MKLLRGKNFCLIEEKDVDQCKGTQGRVCMHTFMVSLHNTERARPFLLGYDTRAKGLLGRLLQVWDRLLQFTETNRPVFVFVPTFPFSIPE